jgi:hypothetical protein
MAPITFAKTALKRSDERRSLGTEMTQIDNIVVHAEIGRRLGRLPFVLFLTLGLLLSLLHCADCGFDIATSDPTTISTNLNHGSVPDTPEQRLPCHSGHCLSHVTAQHVAVVAMPGDLVVRPLAFGREQFPAAIAGLPLFKPHRA